MFPILSTFRVRQDGPQLAEKSVTDTPITSKPVDSKAPEPIFIRLIAGELPEALQVLELAALAACGPDNLHGTGEVFYLWRDRFGPWLYHGVLAADAHGLIDRLSVRRWLDSCLIEPEGGLRHWLGSDEPAARVVTIQTGEAEKRLRAAGYGGLIYLLDSATRKGNEDIKACRPPKGGKGWLWPALLDAVKYRTESGRSKSGPLNVPRGLADSGTVAQLRRMSR
ncbi:MAG: hypothetical protein Q8N48_06935 [Thiobacillus sp.]|nr:hypothetical protein [Thiobacillus sp.]MDP2978547.1 hypothetical protein [Thiobacillus sp.]